ncbi:MAG: tRNA lysidine(34) synthetase TilS [Candidatus Tectomicrobia bacterium]|nr:tRNA lysidine(34) synthetase TilS [Candidatus Tectomicrobia bacterium]
MESPPRPAKRPRAVQAFDAKAREGWRACAWEEERGPLLVGFSGGADSTALLLWLAAFSPRPLLAVHVQHGLRGARAERDARHAARFCRERGIPFRLLRVRVAKKGPRGLEAAAREARRRAFSSAARKAGARAVALAHTLDDQAETVLMRLFEGSGPAGLAGMRPSSPLEEGKGVTLLRPLLRLRRAEARAYLRALKARWVEDETNRDEGRLRNRLRRRLWPLIERSLGPSAAEGAARSAELLGAALEALDASIRRARADFLIEGETAVRVASLARAAALPRAVRAGLWRAALAGAGSPSAPKGRRPLGRHLEGIDRLALEGSPSARLDLPGGLQARRDYDSLVIGPRAKAAPAQRREVPLKIPGETIHAGLGIALRARLRRSAPPPGADRLAAVLDADRLGEGAVQRGRRAGDRFHPAGAPGGRKLKEYFIDRKVPRGERERIPLLAVGGEVAWVIGHQVSEKFRARPDSRRLIVLRAEAV